MRAKQALLIVLVIVLFATVWTVSGGPGRRHQPATEPEPTEASLSAAVQNPKDDGKHVLVRFAPGTTSKERAEAHRQNANRVDGRLKDIDVDVVRIKAKHTPKQAAKRYDANPNVQFAEPNFAYSVTATPNDPFYPGNGSSPNLWGLQNTGQDSGRADADIDAPEAWDVAGVATGSPWPVADYAIGIVDTGIDANHPDLAGRVITPCYSVLGGTGIVTSGCPDDHSHGTHVAGTAAAIGNNGRGVVGVAPNAKVLMCKALDSDGSGWTSDVAACVNRLVDDRAAHGVNVISMSLGGPPTDTLRLSIERAAANGVLPVAAAGNDGNATVHYPAGYTSVISVAATTRTDARASFSNANNDVELAAPGVTTMSTAPGGGYQTKSGTSMATPHAAAAAALVSWHTGLTGEPLREQLTLSADDLGNAGRDPAFGFGRVNLCRALSGPCEAPPLPPPGASPTPTPEPTPTPPPTWRTFDDQTPLALYRGAWSVAQSSKAAGGSFHRASTAGAYVTYYFNGVGVRWIGQRKKSAGITSVRLDGVKIGRVNGYSPTTIWKKVLFERTQLAPGTHTLELYVTGRKSAAATSTVTFVDALSVLK